MVGVYDICNNDTTPIRLAIREDVPICIPSGIYVNLENAFFNVAAPTTDALFSGFTVVISYKLYGDELRLQPTAG